MRRRSLVLLVTALGVLAAVFAAALAFARAAGEDASYRGSEVQPDVRLPPFMLRDENGNVVNSRDLRGKVVAVTFLETKCKEACPIIAGLIDMGLERLSADERDDVSVVAISTHPRDDTPASVRAFLRRHRVTGDMHYLIGSAARLRRVWNSFKILSALESGDADTHSASVRIFNRRGRWVSTLHPGVDLTAANFAHDVRVALEADR